MIRPFIISGAQVYIILSKCGLEALQDFSSPSAGTHFIEGTKPVSATRLKLSTVFIESASRMLSCKTEDAFA